MLGLRTKILIAFAGLLAILIAVSVLGNVVFRRYAATNQHVMQEDLSSVTAADDLQISLQAIDQLLLESRDGNQIDAAALHKLERMFQTALTEQDASVNLPAEHDATARLERFWAEYQTGYGKLLTEPDTERRRAIYHQQLVPLSRGMRATIEQIFRMNADDIREAHSAALARSRTSAWAMRVLTLCGCIGAIGFAFVIGRIILRPVATLTSVVRQIEQGNLELRIAAGAHDELGRLAEAVNSMAAQLCVLKKVDHERLVRTRHTAQLAIDSLQDAVIVVNPQDKVEIANETARRLLGLQTDSELSAGPEQWLAELHYRVSITGQAQQSGGYEAAIRKEDAGQTRFFLPSALPILDENRQPIGTTIVLNDVTRLRQLDDTKNNLLAMVSHELKTPLTSMRIVLPLLLEERIDSLSARQRELVAAANEDADRLHKLVENLLDLGRIAAGRAIMEARPADPNKIVCAAVDRLRCAFSERSITLRTNLLDHVPAVQADTVRIGHVLANLLDNAKRYSREGGIVTIAVQPLEDVVEISVSDNGIGIPRRFLPHVFERFFRVPGQPGDSGSGLGLAIVKDIVEAHGGRVSVESAPESGTTFRFTLPRADHALAQTKDDQHEFDSTVVTARAWA